MTFPYPLTPKVRADLWRFFGMADADAVFEAENYDGPELPNEGVTRSGDALTDTPFARAFVAWREARTQSVDSVPDGVIRNVGGGRAVFSITLTMPPPHVGPDPVDVTARTRTLTSKVTP